MEVQCNILDEYLAASLCTELIEVELGQSEAVGTWAVLAYLALVRRTVVNVRQ